MTSDPRKQSPDDRLERDVEKIRAALSGQDRREPPDLLDQAVLNSARRALENPEKKWLRRFPVRWMGAIATASVIVLAIGLVVQQEQETPDLTGEEADRAMRERAAPMTAAAPAEKPALAPAEPAAMADEMRTPEEWIELMLELKASKQETRLFEELEAFQSAYPDYPLPTELRN